MPVERECLRLTWVLQERTASDFPKELKVTTADTLRQTLERSQLLRPPTLGAPPQQTTTWDEFPNGRYGDSRSPAFGELDGYGVSLKVPVSGLTCAHDVRLLTLCAQPADALRLWGHPVTTADIAGLFTSYLSGSLSGIPWCDVPILDETAAIRSELLHLNRARGGADGGREWWTVGSQPAMDGADSADPTFGFGPPGGYIFQKAFVEFFVETKDKDELRRRIDEEEGGKWMGFFAGNRRVSWTVSPETPAADSLSRRATLRRTCRRARWMQ